MFKRFHLAGLVTVAACMFVTAPVCLAATESVEPLYVLPFNQGQAPEDVASALFDTLVERLYEQGEARGIQVTIVKQELTDEDASWFKGKQYLIGEVAQYEEEKGCCFTEIKLTGQVQLNLSTGVKQPIVEVSDELFFNHDMTSPESARNKISARLGKKIAEQLLVQIPVD